MKRITIFGSTGSIGKQTLEVIQAFPGDFKVVGLTAQHNATLLNEQAHAFDAKAQLGLNKKEELIAGADLIVNAIPGFAGLEVSIATLQQGKILLSANKESLAVAGKWLRKIAEENGAQIFPLDSEASAIWQLLHEHGREAVQSVTLTCSGGPFYGHSAQDLINVTVENALNHPTWKMGPKVSLDSATLINKVLEVFEVHHLFNIPLSNINIVIHRQSIVHSMIHTRTGATKMHITQNDMRLFIAYAMHHPNQPTCPWPIIRARKSELSFDQPDAQTFRSLKWLEQHKGNPNFPIILNALNDIATQRFLKKEMSFLEIYDFIEKGLNDWLWEIPPKNLEELIQLHQKITDHYEHRDHSGRRKIRAGGTKQIVG